MKIDNLINCTYYPVGSLVYPDVLFENSEIEKKIKCWCGKKRKVSVIMGRIFAGLGFYASDEITIKNLVIADNRLIFNYSINGLSVSNNEIILEFSDLVYKNLFIVRNGNIEVTCNVMIADYKNINLIINKYRKILNNNVLYTREFNKDFIKFNIMYGNIMLELELYKNGDNIGFEHLFLECEKDLQQYFENLILPKNIDLLYKDIILYLGNVEIYSKFNLSVKVCNDNDEVITDMISLNNGRLNKFITTRNGKIICLNNDGTWSYSDNSSVAMINAKYQDGMVTYGFIYKDGNVPSREEDIVLSDLNRVVMAEVENVKVLSRSLDNKKKGISYGK